VSDAELIADLQRLGEANDGDRPTTVDAEECGTHATTTYQNRFGSWRDALEAAGFEPPPPQRVTTEELLAELRRLYDEFGGRPTTTIVREHGSYSRATYYNRFGSWDDALDAAFETVPTNAIDKGGNEESNTKTYSDEELLEELRRVADIAGSDGPPSISEFEEYSD
ncbi:homing endonuclease associated repeat-containing protein, partial [Halorubrum sp. ARQ200]|uniref:homing endonuclease associated repeat-containing protein n=1 Tax=Halorubrum sp. ARQ200 TaxID=1855872 RepID=UPI0037442CD2